MAERFKPCSIENCNGNAHYTARGAGGLCSGHYQRLRAHGDPCSGRATGWGAVGKWLREHALYAGAECLTWPFSRYADGYGQARYNGQSTKASRAMCIVAHGEPPEAGMEAAHSCGNGHLGCVNPMHLRWDTPKGNAADRVLHGTHVRGARQGGAKLDEEKVRAIRTLRHTRSRQEVAEMFGVSPMTVSDIALRRTWSWLP
jgi:hypothetical protein